MTFEKIIGNNVKAIRQIRGLSQTDLARRIGFHPAAISHIECGRRTPTLKNLMKILCALEVTPESILGKPQNIKPLKKENFANDIIVKCLRSQQ